jgi:hypothetical protein
LKSTEEDGIPARRIAILVAIMGWWQDFRARLALVNEFWFFVRHRKRYWLLPILIFLFLLSLFIVFVEGSAVAPFIYTLF